MRNACPDSERSRSLPLWLLSVLLSVYSSGALGSIFSELFETAARAGEKGAAKVAGRTTIEAAALRAATMVAGASRVVAATLTLSKTGQLTLTVIAGSVVSTVLVKSADDLLKAARDIAGTIVIAPDVVTSYEKFLTPLLESKSHSLKIVDSTGETAALEIRARGSAQSLAVVGNASLTYSPEAWVRRKLLDQRLMQDLHSRIRIVVLSPPTDQVQRHAFQSLFGSRVTFASTGDELLEFLNKAKHRLITVVGHVENDSFVVRSPTGKRMLEVPIETIGSEIERRDSVSLLLGCRVACEARSTGPIEMIDAFDVANGLSNGAEAETAGEFLSTLAKSIGPLHIDTDFYGRLRAVSGANVTLTDRAAMASSFVRILFPSSFGPPALGTRSTDWLIRVGEELLSALMVAGGGWIVGILGFGCSPKMLWNEIKELYAALMERSEDEIDLLSTSERVALFILGPSCVIIITCWTVLAAVFPAFALACIGLVTFPLILIANPRAHQTSREVGLSLFESDTGLRAFIDGGDVSLTGILGAGALCLFWWLVGLPFGDSWENSEGYSTITICLALTGYVWSIWLTRRWPAMIGVAACARTLVAALPLLLLKRGLRISRDFARYLRERTRVASE